MYAHCTPFRNKRFMLDEMTKRNASNFAIIFGVQFSKNIANSEAFCKTISSSINVLFLKSEVNECNTTMRMV